MNAPDLNEPNYYNFINPWPWAIAVSRYAKTFADYLPPDRMTKYSELPRLEMLGGGAYRIVSKKR